MQGVADRPRYIRVHCKGQTTVQYGERSMDIFTTEDSDLYNVSCKGGDGRYWRVAGESSLKPSYPRVSAKYEAINNHPDNGGIRE